MTVEKIGELEALIRKALALADALTLDEVGLRLDQALISMTGDGIAPPEEEPGSVDQPHLRVISTAARSAPRFRD